MKITALNAVAIAVVAALFGLAWVYGPHLPDPVPSHWNFHGEADGFTPKPWGVYMLPAISAGSLLLLMALPVIAPRGFRLDDARKAWDSVLLMLVVFFALLTWLVFRTATGKGPGMETGLPLLLGTLFIALGNYLTKFPKNFFVGIRTPWTLSSDQVWFKTHRVGGRAFMLAGAVTIIGGLLGHGAVVLMIAVSMAALFPIAYSLWAYRRLHGFGSDPDS